MKTFTDYIVTEEYHRLESKDGLDALYNLKHLVNTMFSRIDNGNDFDMNWIKYVEKYLNTIKKEIVKG